MNPSSNPPASLSQKLLFYSLGAGAASLAATPGHAGPADVVVTPVGQTGSTFYFNLQNTVPVSTTSSAGEQFLIQAYGRSKGNVAGLSSGGALLTQSRTGGSAAKPVLRDYALKLSAGTSIGTGDRFTTTGTLDNYSTVSGVFTPGRGAGDWKPGTRGFLGLEIMVNGQIDYGFADLKVINYFLGTANFTLYGFAYDPTGAPITTFQIPEPGSTTALLVAGATGVAALRRRRREAPQPEA